ncbi:MAG TPA: hypothetical protein VGQ99_02085 [Tepidisphaeraceae bacterium]|nr:hypothetical protein [Tepidisphaeraceae bacterium]
MRLLMIAIILIAIIGVAVQLILTTDLPRNLVVSGLESQLGLRVTASSMETGWMGGSTLDDVTLALPLAEESFLQVPRLKIRHSTLFSLLLRQPLHIDEMYFDRPHMIVRQSALGRWNVEEAMALITRAAGGKSADNEQKSKGQPVQLPRVSLSDGTLELIDNENRKVTLKPLEIHGTPQRSLSWHFQATVSDLLRLEGRIAPGQNWNHQVEFTLDHAEEVLKPWFPAWPRPTQLAGNWTGQVNNDSVLGRLDLKRGQIGPVGLNGAIKFSDGGGAATIQPEVLMINLASSKTPIRLTNGALKIAGTRIEAQSLDLASMGGAARLDGHYDWHARAGELKAAWSDMTLPGQVRHGGELEALIDTPRAGRPQIKATLHTQGNFSNGDWNSHLNLLGTGPSWDAVDWTIKVADLQIREPGRQLQLADLNAHFTTRSNLLTLDDLRVAQTDHLRGGGAFNFGTRDWWLWLDTRQLSLPGFRKPVFLSFNASGDDKRIDLAQLYYRVGKFEASVQGSYVYALPKPLNLDLYLWRIPITHVEDPARAVGGELNGQIHANGTLWPRNVDLSGKLLGNDVVIGRRHLGDVAIQLAGAINDDLALIESRELELLEGHWTLSASYDCRKDLTHLDVSVRDFSLHQADSFFSPPPNLAGTVAAQLHLDLPHQDRALMAGRGDWSIKNLQQGKFKADETAGRLAIESDGLFFDDVTLRQGSGSAKGSIKTNFRELTRLAIELNTQNWPLENLPSNLALQFSGNAKVEIDTRQKTATGPLQLNTAITINRKPVGNLSFDTNLAGQVAEMKSINGSIFGGAVEGKGALRWDDILKSTGSLQWHDIDSARLADMWPQLAGIHGTVSGSIEAQPAANPQVNEPLEIDIALKPENAWYRIMSIGDADARIFVGRQRMVLESSSLHLAHGEAHLWGRLTRHDNEFFSHAQMEFKELSINELVESVTPGAAPMTGGITGEMTLFGPLRLPQLQNGAAEVRLTRSDLANNAIIGAVYDAMRLRIGPDEPNGTGRASLRLEQGVLHLTNLYYRNRGAEIRASGQALDILRGGDSPIRGYVVGSARPLRELKFPFFAEADDILNALQKSVTTFHVTGRLHDPILQSAGFNEIGSDLRGFILGDVTSEQRQKSAR